MRKVRRAQRALALLACASASLTACGGPMRSEELGRSVQSLESSAAEGALLAGDVARDRTKATFARAHSRDLSESVDHEAEKLSDADANGEVAVAKRRAVVLAGQIGQALGAIQIEPRNEAVGRQAERTLGRLAARAGRLAEGL
jgi:hypothetical protein